MWRVTVDWGQCFRHCPFFKQSHMYGITHPCMSYLPRINDIWELGHISSQNLELFSVLTAEHRDWEPKPLDPDILIVWVASGSSTS